MSVAPNLETVLNPAQLEAVTTTEGPLLILAGAGSGKTRVIVYRIAHILQEGRAEPYQILAVTFTNKAAQEMRERLLSLAGSAPIHEAWIGTFHSMCGRILRKEAHRLGYTSSFSIYDSDDSKRVVKRVMQSLGFETGKRASVSPAEVHSQIDKAKNNAVMPAAFARLSPTSDAHYVAQKVYGAYQDELRRSNAIDFGDMLLLTVELLTNHPEARHRFQRRFRYVLVDEFQDTNKVQYDFLKLLTEEEKNLAVVGDDDQAIYRWRGAEVKNILNFTKQFPEAKTVTLEENYRSVGNILAAANAVIDRNRQRHKKRLFTSKEMGQPVGIAMLERADEEAWLVAETIAQRIEQGETADRFAVLYRINAQSRLFEQAMNQAGVPYSVVGGTGFFERREVKDIIAYLRLIANPKSAEDFERIANVPARQIGDKTIERLRAAAEKHGIGGAEVLSLSEKELLAAEVPKRATGRVRALGALIEELRTYSKDHSAADVAKQLISKIRYFDHLKHSDPHSAEDRIQNVEELVSSIAEFEEAFGDEGLAGSATPLEAFLELAALTTPSDQQARTGSVKLMTVHAAKGLEFGVVFMVGMEERMFPIRRAIESGDEADIEEERRLCYVGLTRAQEELNLLYAKQRVVFGFNEVRRPSRFLKDIPAEITHHFGKTDESSEFADERDLFDFDPGFDDLEPVIRTSVEPGFHPGSAVYHNTFGEGVVEAVRGSGSAAHLTILFPTVGRKQVVARFVRPTER